MTEPEMNGILFIRMIADGQGKSMADFLIELFGEILGVFAEPLIRKIGRYCKNRIKRRKIRRAKKRAAKAKSKSGANTDS